MHGQIPRAHSRKSRRRHGWGLTPIGAGALLTVLLLSGCAESNESPSQADSTPSSTSTAPSTGPSTSPPETSSSSESAPDAPPQRDPNACGTVPADNGTVVEVLPSDQIDCAESLRIVQLFHKQIAGKQPTDSTRPVADQVESWQCVSGPPKSQGGTTCRDTQTDQVILANLQPIE
ncbi:hypothetical protein EV191_10781 [Tamaricihabitans halophyticus]|uniref:Uncharacterized protein n=1 Tax=Tamaricihabitans halophyticus TaxID=1262583 RepID=A0A4R2QPF6_9PSEU|nr:hypothetical protein EV191_10781 [Tamaricihabitans halophyticus]